MAEHRMLSRAIIDSDNFLDVSQAAQNLYFHLIIRSDDEGFINNPKTIQRILGCSSDTLNELTAAGFLLDFPSGVVVIKHWNAHNKIRSDRITATTCQDERAELTINNAGIYERDIHAACTPQARRIDAAQDKLSKISKDKLSQDNKERVIASEGEAEASTPSRKGYGENFNVFLTDAEFAEFQQLCPQYKKYINDFSNYLKAHSEKSYDDHLAELKLWWSRDSEKRAEKQPKKATESAASYNLNKYDDEAARTPLKYEKRKNSTVAEPPGDCIGW